MKRAVSRRARGFTVIELLIATLVFSVVLLIVTSGILQITRVYYKGVTEANTQGTARAVLDTVSQAIQFSGGNVTLTASPSTPGNSYAFCVGNQQFSYRLGWQVENSPNVVLHQTPHALVQYTLAGCASASPAQNLSVAAVSGRELLGVHMRLSNLSVTNVGTNLYKIQVRVVYGDDDLLNNPTGANASCKGVEAGSQFCAISDLTTIVVKRVL